MSLCVEDFMEKMEKGEKFVTRSVTVTEAHLVNWGGVTQDMHELHLSEEYAKRTEWGGRISYGLLGLALGEGLIYATGIADDTAVGYLGLTHQFLGPIRIGDTIHVEVKVIEAKPSKTKSDRGVVRMARSILNQKGEEVQRGEATFMVLTRAGLKERMAMRAKAGQS